MHIMGFYSLDCRWWHRYLPVLDFMEFCCSVGVHVDEETELEFYEEHRLLFPAARIIKPDDYLRLAATGSNAPEYQTLHHLLNQIHFSSPAGRWPKQSVAHPIDEAFGTLPELVDPHQTQFHPWGSNEEVFYHYWQIYELYQIRRDRGMYADTASVVRHGDEWHFTPSHTIKSTLLGRQPVAEGDYLGIHDDFDALSRFVYLYNQEHHRTFGPIYPNEDEDWGKCLSPGDYEQYKSRVVNIAKDTSQQHKVDEDCLYAFIRKLIEMHYSYQQAEKLGLADSMKTDIGFLMYLIAWTTGQDSTYIAEKAGRLSGQIGGLNYLETIFPNARAQARDKAIKILTLWAQHYNHHVGTFFALDNIGLDALTNYIGKTDLAIFEYVLFTLNETWCTIPDSTQSAAMYLSIKNLAALPEAFLQKMYEHRLASGTIQPVSKPGLYQHACSLFAKETNLSSLWRAIQSGYDIKHHNAKTQAKFIHKFENLWAEMNQPDISNENYLGYCFLMAALVRNFTHHHPVAEDSSLFNNHYLRAIRAILSVVFFSWVYACRQRWID